jgi:hypothetical protein
MKPPSPLRVARLLHGSTLYGRRRDRDEPAIKSRAFAGAAPARRVEAPPRFLQRQCGEMITARDQHNLLPLLKEASADDPAEHQTIYRIG